MANVEWLSTEIGSKKHADLERAAATCLKSGHLWENLETTVTKHGSYTAYCTRCLKARMGTTVEWPVLKSK
jgi:hypothetical protein